MDVWGLMGTLIVITTMALGWLLGSSQIWRQSWWGDPRRNQPAVSLCYSTQRPHGLGQAEGPAWVGAWRRDQPVVVSVGVGVGKGFRVGTVERWASRGQGKALNVMPNGMGFMQGDGEPRGVQAGQDATSPSPNADPAGFSTQLIAGVGGRPGRQADWHSLMPVSSTHCVPGPLLGTGDETPWPLGPDASVRKADDRDGNEQTSGLCFQAVVSAVKSQGARWTVIAAAHLLPVWDLACPAHSVSTESYDM